MIAAHSNELEQDQITNKQFSEHIEIVSDPFCSLLLCSLRKISNLKKKQLSFFGGNLNLMFISLQIKYFTFLNMRDLSEQLEFSYDLVDLELQGPNEQIVATKKPFNTRKKKGVEHNETIDLQRLNQSQKPFKSKFQAPVQPPPKIESVVDEFGEASLFRRVTRINRISSHQDLDIDMDNINLLDNSLNESSEPVKINVVDFQYNILDLNNQTDFGIKED